MEQFVQRVAHVDCRATSARHCDKWKNCSASWPTVATFKQNRICHWKILWQFCVKNRDFGQKMRFVCYICCTLYLERKERAPGVRWVESADLFVWKWWLKWPNSIWGMTCSYENYCPALQPCANVIQQDGSMNRAAPYKKKQQKTTFWKERHVFHVILENNLVCVKTNLEIWCMQHKLCYMRLLLVSQGGTNPGRPVFQPIPHLPHVLTLSSTSADILISVTLFLKVRVYAVYAPLLAHCFGFSTQC